MKWYTMELNKSEWTLIRPTLKELGCRYEASACGMLIHVEVYCTPGVAQIINTAVDNL